MARPAAATLIRICSLGLLLPALAAQEPAPPVQGPPEPPSAPLGIDGVAATVNDVAILFSQLRAATEGEIRGREGDLGRPLNQAERAQIRAMELRKLVDSHALAQSAKTLGILPPDRVEQIFREQLRQEQLDQVRDLGSWLEFSRTLKDSQQSWQTYYLEKRLEKMASLAEEMTIWSRMQNQSNLFITPQMMRDFYRKQRAEFVHDGAAAVGVCAFVGPDAEQVAKEAAAVWRGEEISSRDLEKRLGDRGARALSDLGPITAQSRESLPEDLVAFAIAGPKNVVHDPIQVGNTWRVWKVIDHRAAQARAFDDPTVQEEIRNRLSRVVIGQLRAEATARAHDRTHVWYAREFRAPSSR